MCKKTSNLVAEDRSIPDQKLILILLGSAALTGVVGIYFSMDINATDKKVTHFTRKLLFIKSFELTCVYQATVKIC